MAGEIFLHSASAPPLGLPCIHPAQAVYDGTIAALTKHAGGCTDEQKAAWKALFDTAIADATSNGWA